MILVRAGRCDEKFANKSIWLDMSPEDEMTASRL